jgi:hypothetical protein
MARRARISKAVWIDIFDVIPESARPSLRAQDACREALETALELYFAHAEHKGDPLKRRHRASSGKPQSQAHRPNNAVRHGFVGDVFDAYMTLRDDEVDDARGFKKFATALFSKFHLPLRITDHDMARLRAERAPFIRHVTEHWKT